jgi:hypothetical protein
MAWLPPVLFYASGTSADAPLASGAAAEVSGARDIGMTVMIHQSGTYD